MMSNMEEHLAGKFIEKITHGKSARTERFYEIFSARGFLLDFDRSSGNVRLSGESHPDDGKFLETLQDIHYKKLCNSPHQDAITGDSGSNTDSTQYRHPYFTAINASQFDIDNTQYLTEIFTQKIPVDLFRLNWERDWYGKYDQFRKCAPIPEIRVYDLEPFIARLVKAVSSVGISTWSSCEGHLEESAYIKFDGKYHRLWFQTIFDKFIRKKLRLACNWDWLGWDERCFISSPNGGKLELYLEIQEVARFIYDNRVFLRDSKKQICALLTDTYKKMSKKELLNVFEGYWEESVTKATT